MTAPKKLGLQKPPVLFLDIDGVVNSRRYFVERYDGAGHGLTWEQAQIDPAAIAILNHIVESTGCEVVISSTWRLEHEFPDLRGILRARGFVGRIIGATPDLDGKERGHEIQTWLDAHPERATFAIVDDDADMAHLAHRLVRTAFEHGLTNAYAARLIVMLGSPR